MADPETYGLRIEKKIDSMQSEIRTLSDHVTRLTFINEAHKTAGEENRKDIDQVCVRVGNLEKKSAAQEGGLTIIRIIISIFAGVVISACVWVGSSIVQSSRDDSVIKEKLTRLEADVAIIRGQ
ncbi:hypothetical protein [Acinetobacter indicus]|uniref:hypothetical protein n=1 Tax=Acinetobacter indicus TaxID=756892 RepID=UPI000CEBE99F|nr:hypothetical protein [Acinetobacter indicus]